MADDTYDPRNYQDEIDANDSSVDEFSNESGDDPSKELNIDSKEFANELDKYDPDEPSDESDDRREQIEDLDEDPTGE